MVLSIDPSAKLTYAIYSGVPVEDGDLFVTTSYPVLDEKRGSTLNGYLGALNYMLDLTVPRFNQQGGTMVIPGHGRLSNESDVDDYRNWMTIVRDRIRDLIKEGRTLAQVKAALKEQSLRAIRSLIALAACMRSAGAGNEVPGARWILASLGLMVASLVLFAVAIAVADRVLMQENAIYSVISPEGCASILWKSADKARDAAEAGRVLSSGLADCGTPSAGAVLTSDPTMAPPGGGQCVQSLVEIDSGPNKGANTVLEFSGGPGQPQLLGDEAGRLVTVAEVGIARLEVALRDYDVVHKETFRSFDDDTGRNRGAEDRFPRCIEHLQLKLDRFKIHHGCHKNLTGS